MTKLRARVGRADLLHAWRADGLAGSRRMARLLGLSELPEAREQFLDMPTVRMRSQPGKPTVEQPAPESELELDPVPFWRLEAVSYADEEQRPAELPPGPALRPEDLAPDPEARRPPSPPIAPWPALWSAISTALRSLTPGRALDIDQAVERLARLELVEPLPRRESSSQPSMLTVLLDRSARLRPIWPDQDELLHELHRLFGDGLRVAPTLDGDLPPVWIQLLAKQATPLLVVSDLGCYLGERLRSSWRRLGTRLRRRGVPCCALLPCPASRWDEHLADLWRAIDWSRPLSVDKGRVGLPATKASRSRHHKQHRSLQEEVPAVGAGLAPARADGTTIRAREDVARAISQAQRHEDARDERAARLLALVSPALRVEPGLLRAARRLLPPDEADLGTEIDAWNHPDVDGSSPVAMKIEAEHVEHYREKLLEESTELQAKVAALIGWWHKYLPRDVYFEEWQTAFDGGIAGKAGATAVEEAVDFYNRMARSLQGASGSGELGEGVKNYMRRALPRMSVPKSDSPTRAALLHCWAQMRAKDESLAVPADLAPEVQALIGAKKSPIRWQVAQRGARLELRPGHIADPEGHASWLGSIDLVKGELDVAVDGGPASPADPARSVLIGTPGTFDLIGRHQRLTMRRYEKPEWAESVGRDHFGLWAEIEVEGVRHRLRWIPPGRFWMGSPEDEAGRADWEGPRHPVVLSAGFWLGETPVTQDLWTALAGSNPSRFQSPRRPVEQVSWEECRGFLGQLDDYFRDRGTEGFGARLPTEAEWEYACRAGTSVATYAGELEIRGERDAPLLDAIAWYSGNSGVELDLLDGADSSGWEEKQYPHEKAATREVGGKAPNPWGLHDMLGNVYEWCQDAWDLSGYGGEDLRVDPVAEMGSGRVFRGGSWSSNARYVRAASRLGGPPGLRHGLVGFRLARGQGGTGRDGAGRPGAAVGARRGTSPRPRAPRPTGNLEWASRVEPDRFGWWASFEVENIEHRMRWVAPGTFLMGSPKDEEGRWGDEGPQHEVEISKGFWLGETPCTQDLWQAVTGANPSEFKSPRRPVEQVSWEDCKAFLAKLNERCTGLGLRLPTEAEWEYACRAGTETSTYAGQLVIEGERNGPVLDEIAWYGGNSGVDFDLEQGWDSSKWKEKQYPHEVAGTRIVGLKKPNPFGLLDMLGNVLEWCEDAWDYGESYAEGKQVDPVGAVGSYRVIRGGSWFSHARYVRAAYRFGRLPGDRLGLVGFRLARGQG